MSTQGNTIEATTTYTATVTENDSNATELVVTVTTGDDNEAWIDAAELTTRAYDNPAGEFDADSFDANTYAEDIATALGTIGWRPVDGITVDGEVTTFTVERF